MRLSTTFLIIVLALGLTLDGFARRSHLTPEQKSQLSQAQAVLLNVLALTEDGRADATSIQQVLKDRMEEIGFSVVTDRTQDFDVELKVKCEERKTWTGTTAAGGDAELADAPVRLWKGPACRITYLIGGKNLGWVKEIRTPFEDAFQAAQAAQEPNSGLYALTQLQSILKQYDFPVLLSAEWGQINRLLTLLDATETLKLRKLKILSLLSDLESEEALPHLTKLLQEKDLGKEAIEALSGVGIESIPLLIDLFQNSKQSDIKAAAAKALGNVAGSTGDPSTIPPLVEYLKAVLPNIKTSEDINFTVLTQVVWSLGKLRDDSSMEPMGQLNEKVWLIYDNSKEMRDLREASNWTYKQLDLDGHIS